MFLAWGVQESGLTAWPVQQALPSTLFIWEGEFPRLVTTRFLADRPMVSKQGLTKVTLHFHTPFKIGVKMSSMKLLVNNLVNTLRSSSTRSLKPFPSCKMSGQYRTGKLSLWLTRRSTKHPEKNCKWKIFLCLQSSPAGRAVTWGCWETQFKSHLQLSVNPLIGKSHWLS